MNENELKNKLKKEEKMPKKAIKIFYLMGSYLVETNRDLHTLTRVLRRGRHYPLIVKAYNKADLIEKVKKWVAKNCPTNPKVEVLRKKDQPYYTGTATEILVRKTIFEVPSTTQAHLPQELEKRISIQF